MSKVFVINQSGHDFSKAEKYGELVFLSEGKINPFKVNNMYRQFSSKMDNCQPDDYILVTGLSQLCMIAAGIQVHKHGKVNMLIYSSRDDDYVPREIDVTNLIEN